MPVHDWISVEDAIFHAFHYSWITHLSEALNQGILPEDYYALPDQEAGPFGPDVLTLQNVPAAKILDRPGGATTLAQTPPRVRFTSILSTPRSRRRPRAVVIRHVTNHRVVALIEVVSPGNKSSHQAMRSFLDKVTTLITRGIHLLVVDLLPPGKRDPNRIHGAVCTACGEPVPQWPAGEPVTLASYAGGPSPTAYVETVAVGDPLPEMPLFLLPQWYVNVPLETTYEQTWRGLPLVWRSVLAATPE